MALFKSLRHSSNFVEVHPIRVPMFVSARLCLGKTCLCYDLKVNINLHFKYSSRCKNDKSRRDNIIDHGLPRLAPLKPTKKTKNIVIAHAHKRNFRRDRATRTVCRICSVSRRHTHQNQAPGRSQHLIEEQGSPGRGGDSRGALPN